MIRSIPLAILLFCVAGTANAQSILLAEDAKTGTTDRVSITLTMTGHIKSAGADGKTENMDLRATATHRYAERIDAVDANGRVTRAIRGYSTCESEATLPGAKTRRVLPANRKLIVVQKSADETIVYSPLGSLTRDELDVTSGHFDTTCFPGLLPGKEVKIGETWSIPPAVVQAVCLFDGVTKQDWTGKLTDVKDGKATFTIEGTAEGVEVGASVKLTVSMKGQFDVNAKRVVTLSLDETDLREQGPVAPACDVKAKLEITRTGVTERSGRTDGGGSGKAADTGKIAPGLLALRHDDSAGKYGFFYPREWHIVAATNDHLVMRLVDRGEFIAQSTILGWKKVPPGSHATVAEIKDAIAKQPGWVAETMTEDGEVPTDAGRWLYRLVARGKQDDVAVQQAFHLLAGPNGEQVVVTVIARTEAASRIGTRDVQLVNSIDFPRKDPR